MKLLAKGALELGCQPGTCPVLPEVAGHSSLLRV